MKRGLSVRVALLAVLWSALCDASGSLTVPKHHEREIELALYPSAYIPLPVGSITPRGWLLEQLRLQAQGLSGHLSHFWDDVMKSIWIGGDADSDLHERVPYWLNGETFWLVSKDLAVRGLY